MTHCLIVDDSRVVRKVVRRILEDLKFECKEAEDGEDALKSCQHQMPDVIILDWNMPHMNGIEFTKTLRSLSEGGIPKIIFCTVEYERAKIEEALASGADEFIMKPFDGPIIQSKLHHVGMLES